jgi:hypothetical protein
VVVAAAPSTQQFAVVYGGTAYMVGLAASVLFGLPTFLLARQPHVLRLPTFLAVAVFLAVGFSLLVACGTWGCMRGPWLVYFFAVFSAVATAIALHLLLPRQRAL